MAKKKYLIVGQGIAGSVLALEMLNRNLDFVVVDKPQLSSSSKIAAGIVNPIVLKRLKMVQGADQFLVSSQSFYSDWQKKLKNHFYHPIPICHLFSKQENQNEWMEKSANSPFHNYLGKVVPKSPDHFKSQYGYGKMKGTSWMNTAKFLDFVKTHLQSLGKIKEKEVDWDELEIIKQEVNATDVIICNGHLLRKHKIYESLFSSTRGELLTITSKDIPQNEIFHAGVFILPLGKELFKVGATYHWKNLKDEVSEEGKFKLIEELEKMFSGAYKIVDHQAGVRPNTKDRKPLLGKKDNWNIFNGLGSRGVLMAPYLAKHMVDYLETQTEINPEYNLNRFFPK